MCNPILMNLIRMFVLAISRPSSNMGHVRLTCRSPGQILEKSCLHSRGRICDWIFMKLVENVCFFSICNPSSNMGHVGSKTRSPEQMLGNSCLHSRG